MAAKDKDALLWNGGVIPYVIDADHGAEASIHALMAELEASTNLRFVRRQYHPDWLRFDRNTVGFSHTDDTGRGDPRVLSNSLEDMGTWRHEMGHALGLVHEQQRTDRDLHVRIHWENIDDGIQSQFEMRETQNSPRYDYRSRMHYHVGDPSRPNMEILDPTVDPATVGTGADYSADDIAFINELYGGGPPPVRRSSGGALSYATPELSVVAKAWPGSADNTMLFMASLQGGRLILHRARIGRDGSVFIGLDTGDTHGHATDVHLAWVNDGLVGAMRNANGHLYLLSWNDSLQKLADSGTLAGEATLVRIVALADEHFVTVCRKGNGRQFLILWRRLSDGRFERRTDSADLGDGALSLEVVWLRSTADEHILATVARLPDSERAHVTTWSVRTGDGRIQRRGDSGTLMGKADLVHGVSVLGQLVVACRSAAGKLLLIPLRMDNDGRNITRGPEGNDGGAGPIHDLRVLARTAYGFITLVKDANHELLLIKWALRNGQLHRLGSSGDQAGKYIAADLCAVPNSTTASLCTAVTTPNQHPMLITWDDLDGPGELVR